MSCGAGKKKICDVYRQRISHVARVENKVLRRRSFFIKTLFHSGLYLKFEISNTESSQHRNIEIKQIKFRKRGEV